ncbi:protein kinase [Kitasatospora sp. NPDC048194]|uniref:serine/threonine-protein kinase n=1 Tax=Kitasatospora sp. NPDC048194 TaxID=3364045 RepID=UPI003719B735
MSSAGTVLGGRYTLVEKIGGGGMGAVWRADDEVLARQVAIKILRAELFEDGTAVQRFRREAQLVAAIDHPGIVDVHDYGESGGDGAERCAYIVMDLIEGRPLNQVLKDGGPMSAERALGLLAEALDALHAAHRRGIVHRDLKPSNLMVRDDDRVVVTDFGIARAIASTKLTAPYAIIGTAAYMSPEQAASASTGPASDLYSIGVVCYELLVGQVPYLGEGPLQVALKHVNQPVPELPETFPAAVRALVATALAKNPDDRYASAAEMAAAARAAIGAPAAPWRPADTGTIDLRAAGKGASGAEDAGGAGRDQVVKVDPDARTEPGGRRSRRTLLVPIVIPVVISLGTATALLIDRGPGTADAAPPAAQPTVVVTVPAVQSATTAAGTATPATPPPADTPSAAPAADQPPAGGQPNAAAPAPAQGGGAPGGVAGGGAGGGAAQPGRGGGGANPGSGNAGSSSGSSAGQANQPTGSGGGGGGGSVNPPAANPQQPGQTNNGGNPPAPQTPARPASCGGDSWSTIVSAKDGRAIGLRDDTLSGDNPIVLGGATQYGWVRSTNPGSWIEFHACNNGGPSLVQTMDGKVTLNGGFSFLTNWSVRNGSSSGTYTLADYQNQSCMTSNGPGNPVTMVTCTPGNPSQQWRFQ